MNTSRSTSRFEDVPPLSVLLPFFLTAPIALAAAGVDLMWNGSEVFVSRWSLLTVSTTHLGTLGFITLVMMGALYQMLAVVARSPVPWIRLAHLVHAFMTVGVALLAWGLGSGQPRVVFHAIALLGLGTLAFLIPVTVALWRAPAVNETVFGMRTAVGSFFMAAFVGLWMAHGFSGMRYPGARELWAYGHVGIALLGWVGGFTMAVSWRGLSMFPEATEPLRAASRGLPCLTIAGTSLPFAILLGDYFELLPLSQEAMKSWITASLSLAAIAVWGLHPIVALRGLAARGRASSDPGLLFWRAGLVGGLSSGLACVAAHVLADGRWDLLFGWIAVAGWGAMIVHGMVIRILPDLIWMHRFAPDERDTAVSSGGSLLPDRGAEVGVVIHIVVVGLGALAIVLGSDVLTRATGAVLLAMALWLLRGLGRVAMRRPDTANSAS